MRGGGVGLVGRGLVCVLNCQTAKQNRPLLLCGRGGSPEFPFLFPSPKRGGWRAEKTRDLGSFAGPPELRVRETRKCASGRRILRSMRLVPRRATRYLSPYGFLGGRTRRACLTRSTF